MLHAGPGCAKGVGQPRPARHFTRAQGPVCLPSPTRERHGGTAAAVPRPGRGWRVAGRGRSQPRQAPGAGPGPPPRRGGGGRPGGGPPRRPPGRGRAPQGRRSRQPGAGRRRGRRRGPGARRAGHPPPRPGHGRGPGRGRPPDGRGGQADRRLPRRPAPPRAGRPDRRPGRRRRGHRLDLRGGRLLHPPGRRHPGPGGRARRPARPGGPALAGGRPGGGAASPPTPTSTSARSTSASPRSTTTRSCAAWRRGAPRPHARLDASRLQRWRASMPSSPPSDLGLAAKSIAFHPTEAELREYADAMPQARQTEYGNVNVQTKVVSRSKGSTYVVTDRPDEHSDQTIDREEGGAAGRLPGRVHPRPGHGGGRRLRRPRRPLPHPGPAGHREGQRQHRRHAAVPLLRPGRRRHRPRARDHHDLHPQPGRSRLPRRPGDRRRPRRRRDPGPELRLLRGVEEGRPADVEPQGLRGRRAGHARRLQGHPDLRRRADHADRRPVGDGQDDHHLHQAERLPGGPGRLHRAVRRGQDRLHRGRLLRQDLRPLGRPTSRPSTAP